MKSVLMINNCRLYNDLSDDNFVNIQINDGKITKIGKKIINPNAITINAERHIITPGFLDIHIQGAGGADVMDSAVALKHISKTLAKFGVTGFLATTVIKPEIDNEHLEIIAENVDKDLGGARILGIHLEGPFINPQKRGGIALSAIFPPSLSILKGIVHKCNGTLRMMTIAPELNGNFDTIKFLKENNIVAALGHSSANYHEAKAGFAAGISHITHIFNAMPPLHHREPGPVGACFESDKITAQIIADGVHLHPAIVKMIYQNLGPDRCICITDGVQAMGLPEGKYLYNGREYESRDGSARYNDGTLIGTAMGINEICQRFRRFTGCSMAEAITTISQNPAKILNKETSIGKITVGADADLVLLDQYESILMTIVKGKIVYQKDH